MDVLTSLCTALARREYKFIYLTSGTYICTNGQDANIPNDYEVTLQPDAAGGDIIFDCMCT